MFSAVIEDTKSWKASIDAIAVLIDEGTLQLTKDGVKLRAMDPSQIAMVDFSMPKDSFEKYEIDKDISMGIDFSELNKITKRAKLEDKIELSLDKRLNITFKGTTTRKFSVPIIESSSTPPKEPGIDFTADLKVNANTFKEVLKDAELVSNHVSLGIDKSFGVRADGDTGSVNVEFGEDNILNLDAKEKAKSTFSLDYLKNMLSAADTGTVVELKMKTDTPLRLEYGIGDSRVVYYLAPRIESR
ncbi:MAG: proliferating cell nuclear antigen (pcna) [Candidatus Altiarchaeales archaeon WOR_SM1_79]|nr:MAG: proliferating cell nuclear antigen (pcna) [Candidatus Altiarchaeales archaeon WOR_SM1_79]